MTLSIKTTALYELPVVKYKYLFEHAPRILNYLLVMRKTVCDILINYNVQTIIYLISVVNQLYEAEILTEYVIRGNAAVLKCSIPSFVADFVKVESWIDEEGTVITHSDDLGTITITSLNNEVTTSRRRTKRLSHTFTRSFPTSRLIIILQSCHRIT